MQNVKKEIINKIEDKKNQIKEQQDIIANEWAEIKKELEKLKDSFKKEEADEKEV